MACFFPAALAESNLPFRVDVLDWAATSESFRGIIEGEFEDLNY